MSKSKEQCSNIISKNFSGMEDDDNKNLLEAIELSIKEICASEFGLLWRYDRDSNTVKILNQDNMESLKVSSSLLEEVIVSKKGFYDNHIASHRNFNPTFDNPQKIKIKSLLIVPILDKDKVIIGLISAYNSVDHGEEFQRYDLRCLNLLNALAFKIIEVDKSEHPSKVKKSTNPISKKNVIEKKTLPKEVKKTVSKAVSKADLEEALKKEKEKVQRLEKELTQKVNELNATVEEASVYDSELVEEDENFAVDSNEKNNEIKTILDFLGNEVTYFANEEHKIYLFLEIIKNSLHDKEQLRFIDNQLDKSQLVNGLATELYTRERLPVNLEPFSPYAVIASVVNLYTSHFSNKNMIFNSFIDPHLPSSIILDVDKVKSLIIHLINNVCGLIGKQGTVSLAVVFSHETQTLDIEIQGIKEQENNGFFSSSKSNHSLVTSDTGLGLSISSNLVNILGGKLKLSTIGKDEHSFIVSLPAEISVENKKTFYSKSPLKIGILMSEENQLALDNLQCYLGSFGITKSNILIFKSYKKMNNIKISHLICFENMLSQKISMKNFSSVTILKYSEEKMQRKYNIDTEVNELFVNSYYGMHLQKILLPHIPLEEMEEGTVLKEDTFFGKIKRLYS